MTKPYSEEIFGRAWWRLLWWAQAEGMRHSGSAAGDLKPHTSCQYSPVWTQYR